MKLAFFTIDLGGEDNIVVFDDPVAFIFWIVRNFRTRNSYNKKIWCLEIYDKQILGNTLLKRLRNLFFSTISFISFSMADMVIFPSELRRFYMLNRWYGAFVRKTSIVINYPAIPAIPANAGGVGCRFLESVEALKKDGKMLLLYAGSIQQGRNLEPWVDFVNGQTKYHLILAGPIKDQKDIYSKQPSTTYVGQLSQEDLAALYRLCDVGILNYENTPLNSQLCAPVKIWEYRHYGLVIVANKNLALLTEWAAYVDAFYDEENLCEVLVGCCATGQRIAKAVPELDITPFAIEN